MIPGNDSWTPDRHSAANYRGVGMTCNRRLGDDSPRPGMQVTSKAPWDLAATLRHGLGNDNDLVLACRIFELAA